MYHKIKPKAITLGKELVVEDKKKIRKCGKYSLCIGAMYGTIKAQIKSVLIQKRTVKTLQLKGKMYYYIK